MWGPSSEMQGFIYPLGCARTIRSCARPSAPGLNISPPRHTHYNNKTPPHNNLKTTTMTNANYDVHDGRLANDNDNDLLVKRHGIWFVFFLNSYFTLLILPPDPRAHYDNATQQQQQLPRHQTTTTETMAI
jgi:hypothetical protein